MLKKKYRLTNNSAFVATYSNRQFVCGKYLTLYVGKQNSLNNNTKVGFVISNRVIKKAVIRNKVKRILREIYRNYILNSQEFNFNYLSLIFVCKVGIVPDFYILRDEMLYLIKKI